MAFWHRLNTLMRADAHGMVDALQDEKLLLRQHLRDAEEAIAAKRARLESLGAELQELERTADRLASRHDDLEADIELALAEGREDLARFAIEQSIPVRRRRAEILERSRHLEGQQLELAEQVKHQAAQLDDLRLKVRAALERERDSENAPWMHAETPVTEEDVELELLRRRALAVETTAATPPQESHHEQ